jgi:hypothetical protein
MAKDGRSNLPEDEVETGFTYEISLYFIICILILHDSFPTLSSRSMTYRTSPDRSENPFLNLGRFRKKITTE